MRDYNYPWKRRIKFPTLTITVGFATGVCAIASIAVHVVSKQYRDNLVFAATAIAAAGGITSAFYIAQNLELDAESKIIDRTLSYIARWNSPDFTKRGVTQLLKEARNENDSKRLIFINEKLDSDENLRQEFIFVLNFFEEMASSIHQKIVDREMLQEFFRGIVRTYVETFSCWIQYRRSTKGDRAFINIERLAEEWNGIRR